MRRTFWEWFVDKFDNFVEKIGCLRSCLQKTRLRDNREKFSKLRIIYLNNKKPASYHGDEPLQYKSNRIKTSKYTVYNFLPKNLWEQFRRVANFYFLINLIILFVIPDPPINPFANAIPLLLVIGLTAVKQAYEDIIRHRADAEFNSKEVRVIRDGTFVTIKSKDIRCGDIVEVPLDQTFPCDLLLLYSKHDNNTCHVKTSNLDGETNLKARTVPHSFPMYDSENELLDISGVVTCEKPNSRLYDFKGKLLYEGKEYLISNENILLRGTHLKIASTIYGCAIYTGGDTKMMLNSRYKSNKLSCVERRLNYYIASTIFIIIFISIGCLVGCILFDYIYSSHWYLWRIEPVYFFTNKSLYYFDSFIFFINLNYFIPLSLYVTLELTRFFGSRFFEWDMEMYDEKTDQPAKVNSTDLNEDLGQIEYLFSDKTGTLTENEMLFKKFSIMGRIFSDQDGEIHEDGSDIPEDHVKEFKHDFYDGKLKRFLEALSVCHTVQIDNTTDEKYNASSPDELSFIKFCQKVGIEYEGDEIVRNGRNNNNNNNNQDGNTTNRSMANSTILRKVTYNNKYEQRDKFYEVLHTLEFDSERKRMSVIVRDRHRNEYVLFCKGADSSIMDRCVCKSERFYETPLRTFAENGWRVIVIAYRILNEYEYKQFDAMLADATNDIVNRDAKLAHAFDKIESGLHILGVTAVEDKLQEDVEITLSELRQAGIKIWVLTGDKVETAINISDSCRHFSSDMVRFIMKGMRKANEIEERFNDIKDSMMKNGDLSFALIVDGETLANIVEADLNETFKEIALKCDSVLCCRMSPSQKAYIVKMVKHSKNNPMTAAIGDGANDVSMIQEAHVGFGIFGKEGRNAAISSDFCFAKFKFLKRALLVHGYLYYTRAAILVLYFFYENMVFNICPLYYSFFTSFSAASIFPGLFQSFYNVVLTSNCPFVFALFEQHTPIDKLEINPFYYRTIAKNKLLSTFQFVKWLCLGLYHSGCAFFLPVGLFSINEVLTSDGKVLDYIAMSELILVLILLFVHIKICLIWNCWNNQVPLALLGDFIGFVIICLVFSAFIIPDILTIFTNQQSIYFGFFILFSSGSVWFFIGVATVIAMAPDLVINVLERLAEDTMLSRLMSDFRSKTSALPSRSNTPTSSFIATSEGSSRDRDRDHHSSSSSRPTTTATTSTSSNKHKGDGGRRVTYVPPIRPNSKVVPTMAAPTPIRIQPVKKAPTIMATKMKTGNSIRLKKISYSDSEETHPKPSLQHDKTRPQTAQPPPQSTARSRTTSRNFDGNAFNSIQI